MDRRQNRLTAETAVSRRDRPVHVVQGHVRQLAKDPAGSGVDRRLGRADFLRSIAENRYMQVEAMAELMPIEPTSAITFSIQGRLDNGHLNIHPIFHHLDGVRPAKRQ